MGHIDHVAIEKELDGSLKKRESYVKYMPEDCYKIRKYGNENGPAAAVRKFKSRFPKLNESTVRSLRQKYQYELTRSKQKDTILEPRIPREPTERPLLLGNKIDAMVQKYIIASGNRGNVISRSIATSTAKTLISRNPGCVGQIDLESSFWAKSLFRRMGFARRRGTMAKLEIQAGAFKEAQLLFTHDIMSKVDKYNIPDSLIIKMDQTPTKYVPVSRSTLAKKNSKAVAIKGSSDKRSITVTFSITFSGKFFTNAAHLWRKNHKIFAQIQISQ